MKTDNSNTTQAADPSWRIGVVCADYYKEEMATMLRFVTDTLSAAGIAEENIEVVSVPGAFEIPLAGAALAKHKQVDALIGIGIIVEGETHHAEQIADACTKGMMDVQLEYHIPFVHEVLYVDSLELAKQRLQKGEAAARCAVDSLALLRGMQS